MLPSAAAHGRLPEWPKGAVCKTVGSAYVGSNPTPATTSQNRPPGPRKRGPAGYVTMVYGERLLHKCRAAVQARVAPRERCGTQMREAQLSSHCGNDGNSVAFKRTESAVENLDPPGRLMKGQAKYSVRAIVACPFLGGIQTIRHYPGPCNWSVFSVQKSRRGAVSAVSAGCQEMERTGQTRCYRVRMSVGMARYAITPVRPGHATAGPLAGGLTCSSYAPSASGPVRRA
jgi:hypothetical protein